MTEGPPTLTVAELMATVNAAVVSALPGPVWVRGEVTGYRRTSGGAGFFRLADPSVDGHVIDVAARGRVMLEIERNLNATGVGALRDGVEARVRGTVGLDQSRSLIRLALLEVDPEFIAGRLAVDRAEILRRLAVDGSLAANSRLPVPLVPLRLGLITSRGSAAHADFLDQLKRSGFRFSVRTVHAAMQGEQATEAVTRALGRLGGEPVDVVVVVRGGGAKLDLATFDSEAVGRAVARMKVPVITGIGHEVDRSVADEAAAIAVKTPTAAAEWLVSRVAEFAGRVDTARRTIAEESRAACVRAGRRLDHAAAVLGGVRGELARQSDRLAHLEAAIASEVRSGIRAQTQELEAIGEMLGTLGVDATLGRGFALVTDPAGRVVRAVDDVAEGDRLSVRLADGTVNVIVEEKHIGRA